MCDYTMASSSGNSNQRSWNAKRRSNSSPELQIHGMESQETDNLPVFQNQNNAKYGEPSCSSTDNNNEAVPRICLQHLRTIPISDGYVGPKLQQTDRSSSKCQSKKDSQAHAYPSAPSPPTHPSPPSHSGPSTPSPIVAVEKESPTLKPENELGFKSRAKRRPNGLSRVASVIVSKFCSRERPNKSERKNSKDLESETSSNNADSPSLQRGRSKSLSSRILRRFRDASRDSSRDGEGQDSQLSTPKHMQSNRETNKSGSERTRTSNTRQCSPLINFDKFDPHMYPTECKEDILRVLREIEIQQGVDPPPGFQPQVFGDTSSQEDSDHSSASSDACTCPADVTKPRTRLSPIVSVATDPTVAPYPHLASIVSKEMKQDFNDCPHSASTAAVTPEATYMTPQAHTQVDYMHCLVPDQQGIMNSCFYWGKIDRYEADEILENKPEGTFLLRDSSQEEFLFSVSFRRYGRTLHARIEQWKHKFSFDAHDPSVYSCDTICGLLEHYKDPNYCMFFEPMLTIPLPRTNPPSLQELARSAICTHTTYDGVHFLELPRVLKDYLKEYHYKQRVRVRNLDAQEQHPPIATQKFVVKNVSNTCISR